MNGKGCDVLKQNDFGGVAVSTSSRLRKQTENYACKHVATASCGHTCIASKVFDDIGIRGIDFRTVSLLHYHQFVHISHRLRCRIGKQTRIFLYVRCQDISFGQMNGLRMQS